jgi:hypothetical protein
MFDKRACWIGFTLCRRKRLHAIHSATACSGPFPRIGIEVEASISIGVSIRDASSVRMAAVVVLGMRLRVVVRSLWCRLRVFHLLPLLFSLLVLLIHQLLLP